MAAIFPSCTSTGNRPSTHPCVIAAQHIMGWRPPDLAYARQEHWRHAVKGTAYCVFDLCRSLGSHHVPHHLPWTATTATAMHRHSCICFFFFNIKRRKILKSSSHVQTFKIKDLWKNNNGCIKARFRSPPTLSFILQRNANVRLIGISTAANTTSASAEFLLQRTPTSLVATQHVLQFPSMDVFEHEGSHASLPPAPGQELCRHVRQLQVDSDAADIHSPTSFFTQTSLLMIFISPPPPLLVFIDFVARSVLYR